MDLRRPAGATEISSARAAMPTYTLAMSVTAQTCITAIAGWFGGPAGTTQSTSASGTNTASSTVSWLSVARMPWASQFGTVARPGASCGTNACTTTGAVG